MATVVLLGTMDTKGAEYGYVRDTLAGLGVEVLVVDAGVRPPDGIVPDIGNEEVAAAAGARAADLAEAGDRRAAVSAMAEGAAKMITSLHAAGRLDAVFGLGGSGGTTLITRAMRDLPVGVPKVMVSTVASGQTRQYVGATDITMMYSVVDIAGLNSFSRRILANAAVAAAGMARVEAPAQAADRPLVGVTMFGVTTPCVDAARARLEELGYEVLVFHATGTGGDSLEALARSGLLAGVLDITTTELADELVGGVFAAGPGRLGGAGAAGVPHVVSTGAMDMVNFGAWDTVPDAFADRNLYRHNDSVTLMRTTPEENRELGTRLAQRLAGGGGRPIIFLPLGGVSMIDVPGAPFHDPAADDALFDAIRGHTGANTEVREMDTHINDPEFARAMADALDTAINTAARRTP